MIRRPLSAPNRQGTKSGTDPVTPEALERRVLLSGGAQNAFARTSVADLNGDGLEDIVVGTTGKGRNANSTPVVLLASATAANTFGPAQAVQVPAGAGTAVAVADVNADGRGDLIVSGSRKAAAGTANPRSPLLLLGNGNGTFGTPASLNIPKTAGASYAFGIGDFNGDARADVVVEGGKAPRQSATTPGGRQVLLLLNNGAGTFAAPVAVPIAMRQVVGLTSGRFGAATGDDLVVAGRGGGGGGKGQGLTIFRNLTGASGATAIPIPASFGNITDAAAGNFNNDANLDLVVASKGGAQRGGGLTLLTGNGDGTFAAGAPIAAAPAGTGTVDTADFNNDANLDLLTGAARPRGRGGFVSTLAAVLNTGTGAFQTATPITILAPTP